MVSILNTVRDLDRLRQIVVVLVRHGFGEVVTRAGLGSLVPGQAKNETGNQRTFAERIRLVLTDLGPSAVKLGQILSTRPDLLPDELIVELKKLQDAVPPVPYEEVRAALELELGAPANEVFAWFDTTPLASASIGQVHRARLKTPRGDVDVVVKIQRPNIKNTIERDIELLYWLAKVVERTSPDSAIYQPQKLVAEFDRAITAELDYTQEADNALRFIENFHGDPTVVFPFPYKPQSSKRVLTLEFIPGLKVYEATKQGASAERIAKNMLHVLMKQIFEDGFFHADPHPGNLLIVGTKEEPVVGMIDLGLVGRLTPQMRDQTVDMMVAVVREDRRGLAEALYKIGRPTKRVDRDGFDAHVARVSDRYLGKQLREIEMSALIRDLVDGATKYGLEIPADFLMVGKALMTVEGIGKQLYPELDVFTEVKPYFLRLFVNRYSPEKLSQELVRSLTKIGGAAAEMPNQVGDVLEDLRKGRLVVRARELMLPDVTDRIGRRLYSGLVVSSLLLGSAICFSTGAWPAGLVFFFFGLVWGGLHMARLALKKAPKDS